MVALWLESAFYKRGKAGVKTLGGRIAAGFTIGVGFIAYLPLLVRKAFPCLCFFGMRIHIKG